MPDAISTPSPLTALLRPGFAPDAGVSIADDFAQLMAGATVTAPAPAHDVKLPKGAAIASTAAIVAALPTIADALPSAQLIVPESEPLPAPPPPPLPELPRADRAPTRQPRPAERQARADTGKTLPPGNDASPDATVAEATQTVSAPVSDGIEPVDASRDRPAAMPLAAMPLAADATQARAGAKPKTVSPAPSTKTAAIPTQSGPVTNAPEKAVEDRRPAKSQAADRRVAIPARTPAFVDTDPAKAAATKIEPQSPVATEKPARDETAATATAPLAAPLDQPAPPPESATVGSMQVESEAAAPVDTPATLDRPDVTPELTLVPPAPFDAAAGAATSGIAPAIATVAPLPGMTPASSKVDAVTTTPAGPRPIDPLATPGIQATGAPLLSSALNAVETPAIPAGAAAPLPRPIGTNDTTTPPAAAARSPRELPLPSAAALAREVRIDAPAPAAAPVIADIAPPRAQPEPTRPTVSTRRVAPNESLPIVTTTTATPPTDQLLRARPNTAFAAEPVAADPRIAEAATLAPAAAPVRHEATVAPHTPVDTTRADWMRGMIERIETIVDHPGQRETRLTLSPDALGEVAVRFRETPDGLVVALDAATPEARAMIAEAAPRLTEMAEARGLRLSMQSGTGGDATSQSNQHREPPRPQGDSPIPNRNMAKTAAKAPGDERIA